MSDDVQKYPGVDLGYDIARSAYSGAEKRMDIIEGRIGALVTVVAGATVAVPTLLRGSGLSLVDPRFVVASVLGVASVCLGLWVRNRGTLKVINPDDIYNKYLSLEDAEFRRRIIYWSGQHFLTNSRSIKTKAFWLDVLTAAFAAQACLIFWWVCVP